MENDELKILIEATLDLEKSLQNMTIDLNRLREKFRDYKIKFTAGLDQSASASQIRADLQKLNKSQNRVNLVGKVDQKATKAEVEAAIK